MSTIPEPVTVHIHAGRTIGPETYNDGYVVVPVVAAQLIRIVSSQERLVRVPLDHVAGEAYCYQPEPGSEISIENVGTTRSTFQKFAPYPCPIPDEAQKPLTPLLTVVIIDKAGASLGEFDLEVATTLAQQITGLMGRTSLPATQGIMMNFGAPRTTAVWMKNTLISLDVMFIGDDGTILSFAKNLQPNSTTAVSSGGPVRAVIEILGGALDNIGAGVGDRVMRPLFP